MQKQTRLDFIKNRFFKLSGGKQIAYQLPVSRKEIKQAGKELRESFAESMNDSLDSGDEITLSTSLSAILGKGKQAKEINPFLTRKERNQLLREVAEFKQAKQKFRSDIHSVPLRLMA